MPMSVLDAMGYGLPVVSTNVGGIPKIVHDGENGYCCDPGNVNQFAKGITEILLDRKERKSFGKLLENRKRGIFARSTLKSN